jgi:ATP-dependent Clp protease ATP-binding subunit ClpC
MPSRPEENEERGDRLMAEEEQAGIERDYERAARKKAERLRLESEFNERTR